MKNTTVAQLAALISGEIKGDSNALITGVANVNDAKPGDVVLADNAKFYKRALNSNATCIVTKLNIDDDYNGKNIISVERPSVAFASILSYFKGGELLPDVGIGQGAVVDSSVKLGENVAIGANCYISRNVEIGDGCVLFPNVFIGEGTKIGEKTKIYPGDVIYYNCTIGKNVILHAGVVIGADGFGYTCRGTELVKLPHAGTVEIGDDVEIGANSAIDRAKTGATVIGSGTKIDNLVHIAHNVKIGNNCVIVAQCGVAGSVEIGNNVTMAGQAGIKDHVTIGDGCMIASRAGVTGNIQEGSVVSGFPARDHSAEKRVQAARLHLPEILQRLRALESEVKQLRNTEKGSRDDNIEL